MKIFLSTIVMFCETETRLNPRILKRKTGINMLRKSLRSSKFRHFLRKNPSIKAYFIKLMHKIRNERDKTGGTSEAAYCYSVWMRHASMIYKHLPDFRFHSILELGPGDTLGVGIAALLGGAKRYVAVDAQNYVNLNLCCAHEKELKRLYAEKSAIPNGGRFADVHPVLERYDFPEDIFQAYGAITQSKWLDPYPSGLISVGQGLESFRSGDNYINYRAPCSPNEISNYVEDNTICLCLSQAVMEHVEDPQVAYSKMFKALRHGGVMSHQVDFKSHGTSYDWNGHWVYNDRQWQIARDRKTFRDINRISLSGHLNLIENAGFKIQYVKKVKMKSDISKFDLHDDYKNLTDSDLVTSGAYILATKP